MDAVASNQDGITHVIDSSETADLIPSSTLPDRTSEQPSAEAAVQAYFRGELDPKYIKVGRHPSEPLAIMSYTDDCQKARRWDNVSMACRGLIFNTETGAIVARPFSKFFNVGETPATQPDQLPKEGFRATEKVDGRLMVMYRDAQGRPQLSSRGSFTSEEATVGSGMLHQLPNLESIPTGVTLMFELVYPDGHVVVDYGDIQELVLLGAIDIASGQELGWDQVQNIASQIQVRTPVVYDFMSVDDLLAEKSRLPAQLEGFVIRFDGGMRVKLKGDAYLELHKQAASVGPKSIACALCLGNLEEYIAGLAEELEDYVRNTAESYIVEGKLLEEAVMKALAAAPSDIENRAMSAWIRENVAEEYKNFAFRILIGKKAIDWTVEALPQSIRGVVSQAITQSL